MSDGWNGLAAADSSVDAAAYGRYTSQQRITVRLNFDCCVLLILMNGDVVLPDTPTLQPLVLGPR